MHCLFLPPKGIKGSLRTRPKLHKRAAVAVRLVSYWDRNPRVWFVQTESQFHLAGIQSQGLKYPHVVSAFCPTAPDAVYNVLSSPAYDQLKVSPASKNRNLRTFPLATAALRRGTRRATSIPVVTSNDSASRTRRQRHGRRPTQRAVLLAAANRRSDGPCGSSRGGRRGHGGLCPVCHHRATDASNKARDIRTPQTSQGYVHELCQRVEQTVLSATRRQDRSPDRSVQTPTALKELVTSLPQPFRSTRTSLRASLRVAGKPTTTGVERSGTRQPHHRKNHWESPTR